MLTQARIKELLSYDQLTGHLIWIARSSPYAKNVAIGSEVISRDSKGYLQAMIDGQRHKAHRIIWMMVHGHWPRMLDHINGIKSDNRIENLRECNNSQNKANGPRYKNNKSGYKGAYFEGNRPGTKKWRAQIRKNGKLINLGYFYTAEEAHETYSRAADKHHGPYARAA